MKKSYFCFFFEPATLACAVVFLLFTVSSLAQQSLQTLHNHVRPAVSSGQTALVDRLPSTQQLNLSIVLPLRNEAALDTLLGQLYDPSSPNFRQFLSVDDFAARFGTPVEDFQAVIDFAKSHGFTVTDTHTNRLTISVRASVGQIEDAFGVHMNVYQHPTENRTFFSPDREPALNLSVPVYHISGLNNFSMPHPTASRGSAGSSSSTGSGPESSYLASDMRTAYYGSGALTGSGQVVGLIEFGGYNLSDVNATLYGHPYSVPINNVIVDGASAAPAACGNGISVDDGEQVLDIAQAIGMAPGLSQVRVYIGPCNDGAGVLSKVASDSQSVAQQVSISWWWNPENHNVIDQYFKEMEAQGQSVFVASGDNGSYESPSQAHAYPAEDELVTAVGGTHLWTNSPGGSYQSEIAWGSSGGGPSQDVIVIPAWQSGLRGVNGASTTLRNVPDVAMEADFDNYVCDMGVCSGNWGGTSFAAPRWAGFMALANQQAMAAGVAPKGGLGFINPTIYSISEGPNYNNYFYDISSGSSGLYSAAPGYDLVTGWGSPKGQSLINALAGQLPQADAPTNSSSYLTEGSEYPTLEFTETLYDSTPGATIYWQFTGCGTAWGGNALSSGESFYVEDQTSQCRSSSPSGTMYATAPGFLPSATTNIGF